MTIPERALRHEALEPEFGSILVPIFGIPLDDDIVQTAGRLAGETRDDVDEEGAVIEAIWVFEMPLSLPLDAPLPDAQIKRAREALARAKVVGEEYEGVEVATAMVRARRAGQAIVNEARRRGVEAIVLAAEEPSRVRGGRAARRRRPARELRRRDHQVRDQQGAVPRDPDRAAGRLAERSSSADGQQGRELMAERRLHGLQRVLGVNALFSTAYGNVGSSIYYALGLVASFALGLTPIVFVLTGVIFYLTAATYAEATAMYPEAGGSSSFARHAFNEFWSFFAAWGQMLNYVITIAISAFFVPHYLGGLFWPALKTSPGDIIFGIGVVALLVRINVVGVTEAAALNIAPRDHGLLDPAAARARRRRARVLARGPVNNVHLGFAPSWKNFLIAIPVGMIAYTGIETISNMAEEAKDEARTIPAAINRVVIAVFAIYAALPAVALSALPVRCVGHHCQTLLGRQRGQGRVRRRSGARDRQAPPPRARSSTPARSTSGCWPRRSCSSPRTPGSSASRGSSTRWGCTARFPTACGSCTRASARRGSGSSCSARSPA